MAVAELAPIRADESYPLDTFSRMTGIGKHGLRTARKNGLQVRYIGRRGFVLGSDWLTYLRDHGQCER